jgi:hypothetical protein
MNYRQRLLQEEVNAVLASLKEEDLAKAFGYRKDKEEDGKYDIRAAVAYNFVTGRGEKSKGVSMFPGVQYKTTSNKYEFNRLLNKFVAFLKSKGYEITGIYMKGTPEYNRELRIK